MGQCYSKLASIKHHTDKRIDKLNSFFEEIVRKAAVDFNRPEIQDIHTAVSEMLERIKTWINERGVFSISRIQPCGSIKEKTALWKFDIWSNQPFIEFDFLAVLQAACNIKGEADCPDCFRVYTPPVSSEVLEKGGKIHNSNVDQLTHIGNLNTLFNEEMHFCLTSSCSCLEVECGSRHHGFRRFREATSTCLNAKQRCDKCTVDKPTGTLQVDTSYSTHCSLKLLWTSQAKTLLIRDKWCLPKTETMDTLTIDIDFLPALEVFQCKKQRANVAACSSAGLVLNPTSSDYEHYCFLVPKHCRVCYGYKDRWRRSGCLAEIDTVVNKMSDKHRKCYQMLKYLTGHPLLFINSYQTKTAVLHHISSCSDTDEGCAKCVFKVHNELLRACKRKKLKSLHSRSNLLKQIDKHVSDYSSNRISKLIKDMRSVSESDPLSSFLEKLENTAKQVDQSEIE